MRVIRRCQASFKLRQVLPVHCLPELLDRSDRFSRDGRDREAAVDHRIQFLLEFFHAENARSECEAHLGSDRIRAKRIEERCAIGVSLRRMGAFVAA